MEDPIHILSDLHPSVALADYIRDIKVSSSKWRKESGLFPNFKGWGIKEHGIDLNEQWFWVDS